MLLLTAAAASAQNVIHGKFGEANVEGRRVIVHVSVIAPPGQQDRIADDALRGQGARPLQAAEFVTSGIVWNQFIGSGNNSAVAQNYNTSGEKADTLSLLTDTHTTWNSVTQSRFRFTLGAPTTRCPSLVSECPGPQTFDTNNDVGWVAINGCCTLAVTWYGTSTDEADVAMNSKMSWNTATNPTGTYDPEAVLLHENGHVAGLSHSPIVDAIMYAYYTGGAAVLHDDDKRCIVWLYPQDNATAPITGAVKSSSSGNPVISGAKVTIADFPTSATTNASGVYTIPGVPKIGAYTVTASASGFQSFTKTIETFNDAVNFVLTPSTNCRGKKGC